MGYHPLRTLLLLGFLIVPAGCAHRLPEPSFLPATLALPATTRQVLLAREAPSAFFSHQIRVHALERQGGTWRSALPPLVAVVGREGFAPPGEKREGDGRTPSGIFPLELVFGTEPVAPTRMPYRQARAGDLWVDDPLSPDYNRWVREGETAAASFERLLRDDGLYRYGIVIGYNTGPVVPGAGSAIFLHLWRGPDSTTAGCIALSEMDLLALLAWLDPAAHPMIVLGPIVP